MAGAIVVAVGALYVVFAVRELRRQSDHDQEGSAARPMLAIAMGLLPCPLTIIVVGAAMAQGATGQGIALAAGISIGAAVTIGSFGLLGMALRAGGLAFAGRNGTRIRLGFGWLELVTSMLIVILGLLMLSSSLGRLY
jgi:ABC-type nickel/cobalt efflux system permease component RcnA